MTCTHPGPCQLVTTQAAALATGRSPTTIRWWASADGGRRITRRGHQGRWARYCLDQVLQAEADLHRQQHTSAPA